MKYFTKIFFGILIISATTGVTPNGVVPIDAELEFKMQRWDFYNKVYTLPFSEELLKECIYLEKIHNPDVVFTQALLETGFFTSELFNNANNIFGMRLPRKRETTAIGEYDYHAMYEHWTDAVKDYKLFQQYYESKGYDIENEYMTFLKQIGYATDPHYLSKLNIIGDLT